MTKYLRFLTFVTLIVLGSASINAQSIKLLYPTESSVEFSGSEDAVDIKFPHQIQNPSATVLKAKLKVEVLSLTEGHGYHFCDLLQCYPTQTKDFESMFPFDIPALYTSNEVEFYIALEPNGINGDSKFRVTVYIDENPSDMVQYEITFHSGTVSVDELTYTTNIIASSGPNPASEMINFNFETGSIFNNASFEVIDLNGKNVYSKLLTNNPGVLQLNTISFMPGTYFYSLKVDGIRKEIGSFIIER